MDGAEEALLIWLGWAARIDRVSCTRSSSNNRAVPPLIGLEVLNDPSPIKDLVL